MGNGYSMEASFSYNQESERAARIPKKRADAARRAIVASDCGSRQEMETEARRTLELDPECCEAYNVLGYAQSSLEAALPMFLRAVELGPKITPMFAELVAQGELWQHVPLRAYFRAHFNAANTYRKLKKYKEALVHYLRLAELDNNWYSNSSSCKLHKHKNTKTQTQKQNNKPTRNTPPPQRQLLDVNFRYHIPEMFIRLKDFAGLRKFVFVTCKDIVTECFTYASLCVPWIMNMILADYITGKTSRLLFLLHLCYYYNYYFFSSVF